MEIVRYVRCIVQLVHVPAVARTKKVDTMSVYCRCHEASVRRKCSRCRSAARTHSGNSDLWRQQHVDFDNMFEPTFSLSLGHDKDFFDGCRFSVFPRGPVKLIGELLGCTAVARKLLIALVIPSCRRNLLILLDLRSRWLQIL